MKMKELKDYLKQFPFLKEVLQDHYNQRKVNPRDIAFVAVRPWRSLDLTDQSRVHEIGTDQMKGYVLYIIVWKTDGKPKECPWQSAPLGGLKGFWVQFRDMNIGQAIADIETVKSMLWPRNTTKAVIRLAWVKMGEWKSPIKVEIYRVPSGKQNSLPNF